MPKPRISRLIPALLAFFALAGCEFGRAFGGGDLVDSRTTYFSPPDIPRFPFDTPFASLSWGPIESAGPGMVRVDARTFRHVSTRSDRVLARGVYRAPLPLHVYREIIEGTPRGCPQEDRPTCHSWLVLFEAMIIEDGQYSSLSPRRVSIDHDRGHCVLLFWFTGDEAEARAAIERASESTGVTGIVTACERERISGAYDPQTHVFTPGAK